MLTLEMRADGWIEHNGGPCPLNPESWVAVRYRGKADPSKGVLRTHCFAGMFAWHHDGAEDDIIAYRPEICRRRCDWCQP